MRTRVIRTAWTLCRIGALAGLAVTVLVAAAMAQGPSKLGGPSPLARYFPRQDLVVYVEFDGLDAHRDGWTKTAAYRLLNESTTGAMLEQTLARLLDELAPRGGPLQGQGRNLVNLGEQLLRAGFAIGINRAGGTGPPRSFGLVIRGGAKIQPGSILDIFLDRLLPDIAGPHNHSEGVEKPGGRSIHVLSDSPRTALAWWAEGDDLVISVVSPSGVDAMIAALDGREPNAVDHPTRRALVKSDDAAGLEPVGLAFFDMAALPALPREAVALGLDRVERFDYRWGFRGRAIESIVGAVVPAPRTGIPALFDQPAFDVRHLPPLPGGLRGFTVLSLDAIRLHDQVIAALKAIDPTAEREITAFDAMVQQAFGMKLRDDILSPLGSRLTLYNLPATVDAPANLIEGVARALALAPRSAVVLEIKDRDAVVRALAKLAERSGQKATIAGNAPQGATTTVTLNAVPMKPLKGPETGYIFVPSSPSFTLPAGMHPTLLVGRNELVLGTTISTARRARDLHERLGPGLPPGDPLVEALDQLPDRLTLLSVSDSRRSMLADLLVGVPELAETLIVYRQSGFLGLPGLFGFPFSGPRPVPDVPELPPGVEATTTTPAPTGSTPSPFSEKPTVRASATAFDPELIPEADDLRRFLFPSVCALAVNDRGVQFISREAFPTISPSTVVPVAIAMMVPAAHSAQVAARRSRSTKHLKQIGLALHNFVSANNHFPADVIGKDGKPLLSWRVQILPLLDQQALFNEFKLDEPWDSPHNKALLERMPAVFAIPDSAAEPGMTFYRGFAGKSTFFDPAAPQGLELARITDGTSNTISVVEAREAVPWTRPGSDIPFNADPNKLETIQAVLKTLGGHHSGGFNALFCDGAVRFIRESISPVTLRALLTCDGGEVISSDSF
jgi:prepilin-type processing-associated H-X9-DG protein